MPVVKIGDDLVDVTGATPEQLRALKAAYGGKAEPKYTGGQAFLAGATELLGGGDEIAGMLGVPASYLTGKMKGMGPMERFEAGRKKYRGVLDKAQQDHPAAFLSGALVGTGGVTGAATKGLFKGVQSLGQLMSRGAAVGTGEGAIAGLLSGEPGERTESAIQGATLGGAAGAVLPAALRGVGNTGRYLRDKTVKYNDPERVAEHASRKLDDLMDMGDGTVPQLMMKQDAAPGGIIADQSPALQSQLATLATRAGTTGASATEQLTARISQQFPRFEEFFTGALNGVPLTQARQAIQTATKTQASPLYETAKNTPLTAEAQKTLKNIYKRDKESFEKVKDLIRKDMDATPDGTRVNTKTARFANDFQHYLGDKASSLIRSGDKKEAQALIGLRKRMLEVLDEIPGYKDARSLYKEGFASENALDAGENLFKKTIGEVEDLTQHFDSESEREMFKVGAYNAIMERLGKASDLTDATRIFRTPAMHRKMRKVLSEDQYKDFLKRIDTERTQAHTFRAAANAMPATSAAQDTVYNPRATGAPGSLGYLAGGGGGQGAQVAGGVASASALDRLMSATLGPLYGKGNRMRDDRLGQMLLSKTSGDLASMYKPKASPDYGAAGLMGTIPSALYPMLPGN